MNTDETPAEDLRAWAAGNLPLAAATELLIRGGFAQPWRPWVRQDEHSARPWIDFEVIPEELGGMSGGETRFLRIAASLGAGFPVSLGDDIPGLDRDKLTLVLTALSHANGAHEPGTTIEMVDGRPAFARLPALLTWDHSPA